MLVSGSNEKLVAVGDGGNVRVSADRGTTWSVPGVLPDAAVWRGLRVQTDPNIGGLVRPLLDPLAGSA